MNREQQVGSSSDARTGSKEQRAENSPPLWSTKVPMQQESWHCSWDLCPTLLYTFLSSYSSTHRATKLSNNSSQWSVVVSFLRRFNDSSRKSSSVLKGENYDQSALSLSKKREEENTDLRNTRSEQVFQQWKKMEVKKAGGGGGKEN